MAAVLPVRPPCDSNPATPGAQSIKVTFVRHNYINNTNNKNTSHCLLSSLGSVRL